MPPFASAALILLLAVAAAPARAPVAPPAAIPNACQGELCGMDGEWVAERDAPLFAGPGGSSPLSTVRKGARAEILERRIVIDKAGTAVTRAEGQYARLPHGGGGGGDGWIRLPRGARFRTLYYLGEGLVAGMTADGHRFGIDQMEFRPIAPFLASDWTRLRLPDGREGWVRDGDSSCLGHIEVLDDCWLKD